MGFGFAVSNNNNIDIFLKQGWKAISNSVGYSQAIQNAYFSIDFSKLKNGKFLSHNNNSDVFVENIKSNVKNRYTKVVFVLRYYF